MEIIFLVSLELSSTSILVEPRWLKDQSDQGRIKSGSAGAPSRYIPQNQGNTEILPFLSATAASAPADPDLILSIFKFNKYCCHFVMIHK